MIPVVALTQAELLAIAATALGNYYDGLASGDGIEILEAAAAMFARVSTAVERTDRGQYARTATAGGLATVPLVLVRPTATGGAVTVKAGSVARATGTRDFQLTADVAFGGADLGPHSEDAEALFEGYGYNVGIGETWEWYSLETDPAGVDTSFTISNTVAATGGQPPMLDAIARERGLRAAGGPEEPAEDRRRRLLSPLDTVSPNAISDAIASVLGPVEAKLATGEMFEVIETFDPELSGVADCGVSGAMDTVKHSVVADYSPAGYKNRVLDLTTTRACFIVVVPNLPGIRDQGCYADDPGVPVPGYGTRGCPAANVPFGGTAGLMALHSAADGTDQRKAHVYITLYDLLDRVKAGGVIHLVELEGQ